MVNATTQAAFAALDHELTQKPMKDCEHTAHTQKHHDLYDLQSQLYYLSDGGYSRLRIDENGEVHLAQGALAVVQFNWEYAERKIAALNEALRHEF